MPEVNITPAAGHTRSPQRAGSGKPFFTVLIPTMNRHALCAAAIQTVLWQSFGDFELIVSDNSSDEGEHLRTWESTKKYFHDPRVRYIRPASVLNMPNHWEFASRHAAGRYVLILTDRYVMRPSALAFLYSQIRAYPGHNQVVSWYDNSWFNSRTGDVATPPLSGATQIVDSKKLASDYADYRTTRRYLPRTMNGCYSSELAAMIRTRHGRLFHPLAPDDTAAFLQLAYTETHIYIDRPLVMFHGNKSNGNETILCGVGKYLATLGEDASVFTHVPSSIDCVANLVIQDMLVIKSMVGERLLDARLNIVKYYLALYSELILKELKGAQMDVNALYQQWHSDVARLPSNQRAEVEQQAALLSRQRPSMPGFRRLLVRWGARQLYQRMMAPLRVLRNWATGRPNYPDVLAVAQGTDDVLTSDHEGTKSELEVAA